MADVIKKIQVGDETHPIDGAFYLGTLSTVAGNGNSGSYKSVRWYVSSCEGVTVPYDGMRIAIKIPLAGVGTAGAILSLNGNTDADYHPLAYNVSTVLTTHFPVNSIKVFVYDASATMTCYKTANTAVSVTGVWKADSNYDSNTTVTYGTLEYYFRPYVATEALYRYKFVMLDKDNRLVPLTTTNVSSGTAVTNQTPTAKAFKPDKIWWYCTTTTISAGAVVGGQILWRSGYNANNATNGGMAICNFNSTISAYRLIYLCGTFDKTTGLFSLRGGGTASSTQYYTQVPTNTANITLSSYFTSGYDYILLGGTYSSNNYIQLFDNNPMFHFDGTNLVPYDTWNTAQNVPVNADWDATSGLSKILNKPTIPSTYTDVGAASAGHNHDGRYYSTAAAVSTALGLGTAAFSAATSFQAADADLSAIAGLTGTSGLLKKTAADTWSLDTTAYLSAVPAHTSTTATTYGSATNTKYGHVKLISGNLSNVTYAAGAAAAASHNHDGRYPVLGASALEPTQYGSLNLGTNSSTVIPLTAYNTITLDPQVTNFNPYIEVNTNYLGSSGGSTWFNNENAVLYTGGIFYSADVSVFRGSSYTADVFLAFPKFDNDGDEVILPITVNGEYADTEGYIGLTPTITAATSTTYTQLASDTMYRLDLGNESIYFKTPAGGGTQVNADWNATTGVSSIKNKPTLGTAASYASTAFASSGHNHDGRYYSQYDYATFATVTANGVGVGFSGLYGYSESTVKLVDPLLLESTAYIILSQNDNFGVVSMYGSVYDYGGGQFDFIVAASGDIEDARVRFSNFGEVRFAGASLSDTGGIYPNTNNTFDIGTGTSKYRYIYGTYLGTTTYPFTSIICDSIWAKSSVLASQIYSTSVSIRASNGLIYLSAKSQISISAGTAMNISASTYVILSTNVMATTTNYYYKYGDIQGPGLSPIHMGHTHHISIYQQNKIAIQFEVADLNSTRVRTTTATMTSTSADFSSAMSRIARLLYANGYTESGKALIATGWFSGTGSKIVTGIYAEGNGSANVKIVYISAIGSPLSYQAVGWTTGNITIYDSLVRTSAASAYY